MRGQTQPDDHVQLDRLISGFAHVSLEATSEITANNLGSLSVFATQAAYGQPGKDGDLVLSTPLLTADAAAVLKITAGGSLSLVPPVGVAPAATGSVMSLGGEIDLVAGSIDANTAHRAAGGATDRDGAGQYHARCRGKDRSCRARHGYFRPGGAEPGAGTLLLESTAGSIGQAAGSVIDVSRAGGGRGRHRGRRRWQGSVAFDGSLRGTAGGGQAAGSFTVIAGTARRGRRRGGRLRCAERCAGCRRLHRVAQLRGGDRRYRYRQRDDSARIDIVGDGG